MEELKNEPIFDGLDECFDEHSEAINGELEHGETVERSILRLEEMVTDNIDIKSFLAEYDINVDEVDQYGHSNKSAIVQAIGYLKTDSDSSLILLSSLIGENYILGDDSEPPSEKVNAMFTELTNILTFNQELGNYSESHVLLNDRLGMQKYISSSASENLKTCLTGE